MKKFILLSSLIILFSTIGADSVSANSLLLYGTISYNGVPTNNINVAVNDTQASASGAHEILGTTRTDAVGAYQISVNNLQPDKNLTVFASYLPYYALQNITYNGTDSSLEVNLNIIPSENSMVSITVIGSVNNGNNPTPVNRVHINPDVATTTVGESIQFSAEARDISNTPLNPQPVITWSMKNNDTTIGNVDNNGLFTAAVNGQATVVAVMDGIIGEADVTVTGNPSIPICQTSADTNLDGAINFAEIASHVRVWKAGSVSIAEIVSAVRFWKAGIGC